MVKNQIPRRNFPSTTSTQAEEVSNFPDDGVGLDDETANAILAAPINCVPADVEQSWRDFKNKHLEESDICNPQ